MVTWKLGFPLTISSSYWIHTLKVNFPIASRWTLNALNARRNTIHKERKRKFLIASTNFVIRFVILQCAACCTTDSLKDSFFSVCRDLHYVVSLKHRVWGSFIFTLWYDNYYFITFQKLALKKFSALIVDVKRKLAGSRSNFGILSYEYKNFYLFTYLFVRLKFLYELSSNLVLI